MPPLARDARALAGSLDGFCGGRAADAAGIRGRRARGPGLSNRQIAAALHISERTAENHVQHILTKLGLQNRTQVAAWAAGNQLACGRFGLWAGLEGPLRDDPEGSVSYGRVLGLDGQIPQLGQRIGVVAPPLYGECE
jgi:hypothetical protein